MDDRAVYDLDEVTFCNLLKVICFLALCEA